MRAGALPREFYFRRDHTVEVPTWAMVGRPVQTKQYLSLVDGLALMRAKGAQYKRSFCIEITVTVREYLLFTQLASRNEGGCGPGRGPYRIINQARARTLGDILYHDTREAMFATFEARLARYLVGDLEAL